MGTSDLPVGLRTTRRALLSIGIGALVVATLPKMRAAARRRFSRSVPTMGTIAEVAVIDDVDADPRRVHAAIDGAVAELLRVERLLTRYDDASDVGRVNLRAAAGPVPVSDETARVVEEALRFASASDGSFDPCLERPIEVWDVLRRHEPPPASLYRRYAGRRLFQAVDVDRFRDQAVIRFRDADVGLDLGGIAKGYAVDCAAMALRAAGVRDGLVQAGGDLVALGNSERGEPWRVGVRDPNDPEGIVGEVDVSDGAVATSGDYERFFEWRGRRYHHILDSTTASPRRCAAHGVTVSAATCIEADASATAVFGRARADADALLSRRGRGARVVTIV